MVSPAPKVTPIMIVVLYHNIGHFFGITYGEMEHMQKGIQSIPKREKTCWNLWQSANLLCTFRWFLWRATKNGSNQRPIFPTLNHPYSSNHSPRLFVNISWIEMPYNGSSDWILMVHFERKLKLERFPFWFNALRFLPKMLSSNYSISNRDCFKIVKVFFHFGRRCAEDS